MTDIVEDDEVDRDIVDKETLARQFSKRYNLLEEKAAPLNKSYINKIHGNKSLNLAITLSDNTIQLYGLAGSALSGVCKLSGHKKCVTDVVFSPQEEHTLYSAGEDGLIKMWDTRAGGSAVQEYKDEEETIVRPYECMDVSCNGRVLCAGSQVVEDDAYLVFWDPRLTKPLGGYWNSHTEDITQVRFHKEKCEVLATGSLDGLLNVFNIKEETEDSALVYTFNVENSVERLRWVDEARVACLTQSNDLQLWDAHTGDLVSSFDRDKVSRSIKRSKGEDCYLVDMYSLDEGSPVLLAGSHAGTGDVLRSVELRNKKLQPSTDFVENKQIVRCCHYDQQNDVLVTGGEGGLLSVWRGEGAHPALPSRPARAARPQRPRPY